MEVVDANLLLGLNDDCLIAIFEKLSNNDLYKLAISLNRFDELIGPHIIVRRKIILKDIFKANRIRFLSHFGPYIKDITIDVEDLDPPKNKRIISALRRYTPNITSLKSDFTIHRLGDELLQFLRKLFMQLEELHLNACFNGETELNRLFCDATKLEKIVLFNTDFTEMRFDSFVNLKSLTIENCTTETAWSLDSIVPVAKNLKFIEWKLVNRRCNATSKLFKILNECADSLETLKFDCDTIMCR